jgi:phosphatidylserine/phosphatidylglycerophosphate/cardiolipin synthase-like enzyme
MYDQRSTPRSIREHRADDGVPYILDNCAGSLTLHEALLRLLARSHWADIATGYLSLSGFGLLAPALEALQEFRLLFGSSRIADELARELRTERYRAATRTVVERMLAFLERPPLDGREAVQIRRYGTGGPGDFFHAKAFLLDGAAIVGSSNFTANGLTGNTELNAVHREPPIVRDFGDWFERMWEARRASTVKTT